MNPLTEYKNIGVVGSTHSGKTVLLTALINHLLHHDPQKFFLGRDVVVHRAEVLKTKGDVPRFEFEYYRDRLVQDGAWPRKTSLQSVLQLELEWTGRWVPLHLNLMDFPGELVADAPMVPMDYTAWSQTILKRLERLPSNIQGQFFENFRDPADNLLEYKRVLARCRKAYLPFISPSSFVLNASQGLMHSEASVDELAQTRISGLPEQEFAPWRDPNESAQKTSQAIPAQKTSQVWARAYEHYKKQVVMPVLQNLRQADTLVMVIDIPTLLNAGHGMGNDTIDMMREVLNFCDPGVNGLEKIYRWSGFPQLWRGLHSTLGLSSLGDVPLLGEIVQGLDRYLGQSKVSRIAMVASKCDLVHQDDRDRLIILLKQLFQSLLARYVQVDVRWFAVAAALSTRSSIERHSLFGVPTLTEGREEREVMVDPLPQAWPEHWQVGDFSFADFKPRRFPGLNVQAPPQTGLDDLARFILGMEG
jgi:predicted YcjX-like family ATPase